eukprot:COSAG06_NODE_6511_length_2900_cov_4.248126_2_plen_87_part_00
MNVFPEKLLSARLWSITQRDTGTHHCYVRVFGTRANVHTRWLCDADDSPMGQVQPRLRIRTVTTSRRKSSVPMRAQRKTPRQHGNR